MSRIAVIDDEKPMRQLMAEVLATRQHEVESFGDGHTALAAFSVRLPDLIICDVNMPGLSGYKLLDAVRRNPATAAVPVVLITGRDTYESMRQGMVGGADDYLAKPFKAAELFETIDPHLKRMAASRQSQTPQAGKLPANLQAPLDDLAAVAQQLEAGEVSAAVLHACSRRLRQISAKLEIFLSARRVE